MRALVVPAVLLTLALTGCGGADRPAADASPSGTVVSTGGDPGATGSATPTPTPANPEPAAEPDQSAVLDALPGSAGSGCVAAGSRAAVRSGGLAVTQLDLARQQWTPGSRTVRLVFVPQHADQAARLAVTGTRPGGSFAATSERASDTEGKRYFLLTATVPTAGLWTVRATTGADQGCWTVRIS